VREIISSEMWEQVNRAYLMVLAAAEGDALDSPHEFFTAVKNASQLFVGVSYLTMTHNEAWHFGRLGRLIERADKTSRILDVKYFLLLPTVSDVGMAYDDIQWGALLKSASAFEMYRERHGRISPKNIVEFLLMDDEFPRAVRFCLNSARESLHSITGTPAGHFRNPPEKLLGQLHSDLSYTSADEILARGLHEYLDDLQNRVNLIGNGIFESFFASRMPSTSKRSASML
jgi:uncharacterized alpha-E superfamily protein